MNTLSPDGARLAPLIDHTLLKPDATRPQVTTLCSEARSHRFASVCVNPCMTALAARELEDSGIPVCTVIGFPLGTADTRTKVFEATQAIRAGARELDMVLNIGALKESLHTVVHDDIAAVVRAAPGLVVKVILETCLLDRNEKIRACHLAVDAGAAFVKTSTGFSSAGATAEDVQLMRQTCGPSFGVKASGGIRTLPDALRMIAAGANRIGASASVAIVTSA